MFFRKNIKYILIIVVLLAVILATLRGTGKPIKGAFFTISSPFLKTFRIFSGGVSGFFDFLGSIGDLKNDNEKLLKENGELITENNRLKDADKENQALREQLDLAPRKKFSLEASFVIAQDPQGQKNYFLIDKGENAGIKPGMSAIVSDGVLVGRVSESYPTTAKVVLITDPSSVVNAEVLDSGAKGIIGGEYGLGLKMDMVSQADVLNEGDTVITSGLGGEIPRGLTIGKINQIGQSANKLFQEALVVPTANFSDLRIIFVVKSF